MSISFTMLFKYFISLVCLSTEQGAYWFEQEMNIRYIKQFILEDKQFILKDRLGNPWTMSVNMLFELSAPKKGEPTPVQGQNF